MFSISISTVVTAVVRRMNWMHGSYDVFVVECCGDVLFAHAKWIDRTSGFSENEYELELYGKETMHAYFILVLLYHANVNVSDF